jgi:hypothetical protein
MAVVLIPSNPYILPNHRIKSYYQSVAGPIDPTYQLIWGADTYSARPVMGTGGSGSWTVGSSGGAVNLATLVNSNAISGVSIGLGTTGTLLLGKDGIPKNPFVYNPAAGSPGSVAYGFTSDDIATAGEFVHGDAFVLERPFPPGTERGPFTAAHIPRQDNWGFMPAHDLNATYRELNTTLRVTQVECDNLEQMWEGQRGMSLPSVVVPRPDRNDAWYGILVSFSYTRLGPNDFTVPFHFREFAKCRW